MERLDIAVRSPVTRIAAPAGCGKSVLLAQWVASRPDLPVVALALEPGDDRSSVAHRAVGALADSGITLGDVRVARIREVLRRDAGDLAGLFGEVVARHAAVLVLDGADTPSEPAVRAELASLATALHPRLHLILSGRSRRSNPLAGGPRLRPGPDIDHLDLAFTESEVRELVRRVAERELDDALVEALTERTEGWAVAGAVAAQALRGRSDPRLIISTISGEHPQIAAYIDKEVLERLPPRARSFLIRSSVLDIMTGPTCEAATGLPAGGLTLRYLEQLGLPVRAVEQSTGVYRWSRLFREHLRHQLRLCGAEADTLRRVARWHADHADPDAAARYFGAAEDWSGLFSVVDEFGKRWYESGQADRVVRWIELVPTGAIDDPAVGALRLAYLHTMEGRTRLAATALREVEAHGCSRALSACVETLRASWMFIDASPSMGSQAAARALADLQHVTDDDLPDVLGMTTVSSLRTIASGVLAAGTWLGGDVEGGRQALRELLSGRGLYPPWRAHLLGVLALLEAWHGNLGRAGRLGEANLRLAARTGIHDHPSIVAGLIALAHVRRQRGDLRRALLALHQARGIATRFRRPTMRAMHTVELAALQTAAGEPERALASVRAQWTVGEPPPPPIIRDRLQVEFVRALIAAQQLVRARGELPLHGPPRALDLAPLGVALAVAEGELDTAEAELAAWPDCSASPRGALERDLWTAILCLQRGHRSQALRLASDVITRADVEGYRRVLADAGAPGRQLLRAVMRGVPNAAVRRVAASGSTATHLDGLTLSEREIEVVRYLPTALSNAQIASRLFISLNTLKTHLRAIYRKLGVSGRRDAIRRAQELGIA